MIRLEIKLLNKDDINNNFFDELVHFPSPHDLGLSQIEYDALVASPSNEDTNFKRIYIWKISKSDDVVYLLQDELRQCVLDFSNGLTAATQFVLNERDAIWNDMYRKYGCVFEPTPREIKIGVPWPNYLRDKFRILRKPGSLLEVAILPILSVAMDSALKNVKDANDDVAWIITEAPQFSLRDCLHFSPLKLETRLSRRLYIIYQILRLLEAAHAQGLAWGGLTQMNLHLDDKLWITAEPPPLWLALEKTVLCNNDKLDEPLNLKVSQEKKMELQPHLYDDLTLLPTDWGLPQFLHAWLLGRISNLSYLLVLNKLAGRRFGDPNHHPMVPWVVDFTNEQSGWRDLHRTKYRLAKGDNQLDVQYESSCFVQTAAPYGCSSTMSLEPSASVGIANTSHHISAVLSDITYYTYKARQMPRELLTKHVRPKWVPLEYPGSMERLYAWTPDECIPEFYTDALIFDSVHEDLPDLAIPPWTRTTVDFLAWHREKLESEHVSKHLHHWIDLTFGYKLSGDAAVSEKNVCLQLVDGHSHLQNSGLVQLFTQPHPKRLFKPSIYFGPQLPLHSPHLRRKKYRASVPSMAASAAATAMSAEMLMIRERTVSMSETVQPDEKSPSPLPKEYNPLELLQRFEACYSFVQDSCQCEPPSFERTPEALPSRLFILQRRDLQSVGCLMVELFVPHLCSPEQALLTLEQRVQVCQRVLRLHCVALPRCLRIAATTLLMQDTIEEENGSASSSISCNLRLLPTPNQLLYYLIQFPDYMPRLHQLAASLRRPACPLSRRIHLLHEFLMKRGSRLSADAIDLLCPMSVELFALKNVNASLSAAWTLVTPLGVLLGPVLSAQHLLLPIKELYASEHVTAKHAKLYSKSFLKQLIIQFGLKMFLTHFIHYLVEAVACYRDFPPTEVAQAISIGNGQSPRMGSPTSRLSNSSCEEEVHREYFKSQITHTQLVKEKRSTKTTDGSRSIPSVAMEDNSAAAVEVEFDSTELMFNFEFAEEAVNFENGVVPSAPLDTQSVTSVDEMEDETEDATSQSPDRFSLASAPGLRVGVKEDEEDAARVPLGGSAPNEVTLTFNLLDDDQQAKVEQHQQQHQQQVTSRQSNCLTSDIATDSVLWLSFKLGPLLTAKFVSGNLLRMLVICYQGSTQLEWLKLDQSPLPNGVHTTGRFPLGDSMARHVISCLQRVAVLYGEAFLTHQYLGFVRDCVSQAKQSALILSLKSQAALFAGIVLLQQIIPYMSDNRLNDILNGIILGEIIMDAVCLSSCTQKTFAGGPQARSVFTYKLIDLMYTVGLRLGFEMIRQYMTNVLCRFFESFGLVYCLRRSNFDSQLDWVGFGCEQHQYVVHEHDEMMASLTPTNALCMSNDETCTPAPASLESSSDYFVVKHDSSTGTFQISNSPVQTSSLRIGLGIAGAVAASAATITSSKSLPVPVPTKMCSQQLASEAVMLELRAAFTAECARAAFVPFCRLAGGLHMAQILHNHDLIEKLCSAADEVNDEASSCSDEQLAIKAVRNSSLECNKSRHLLGDWQSYWGHALGMDEKNSGAWDVQQIKLMSFVGHTAAVRHIEMLDSESCFISAAKDKQVLVWAIHNSGKGTDRCNPAVRYTVHSKPLLSVAFLESVRMAVSADTGTVHLWDPFLGQTLKRYEFTRASLVTLCPLAPPSPCVLASGSDGVSHLLDARVGKIVHRLQLGFAPQLRLLASSPSGAQQHVACAFSSGQLATIDLRTGCLLKTWRAHDEEPLALRFASSDTLVSSAGDGQVRVWDVNTRRLCMAFQSECGAQSMHIYRNEIVCSAPPNRLWVCREPKTGTLASRFSSSGSLNAATSLVDQVLPPAPPPITTTVPVTRLQRFSGTITCSSLLPLNRLMLIGADNGSMTLLN